MIVVRLHSFLFFGFYLLVLSSPTYVIAATIEPRPVAGYVPSNGFIPDSATAAAVAEAILIPIYRKSNILSQKPFQIQLQNGIWTISGSPSALLRKGRAGGNFLIQLEKNKGSVIYVIHSK